MLKTQVRPARDLRNNYADIVRSLEQHDHIIITNNGVGESVLIGIDDYAEYEKYLHHRYIYGELQKSKDTLDDQNVIFHDAKDVFARLDKKIEARGL
ncbi:MAG: type II toxin-antitoxin system Phd/YefM family antitoxin [Lachnospiraceae bacterium]|jgi:prevent-host-death family protein|nr:type II toxin-antitoxin system Phd/YefM family antitoxin [Lachnospiraceae bacterium]